MSKNILIIYPHGLGDCLMLTPSIRTLYLKHGIKPSIAILERFKTSEIFTNNPYVDKVFPVLKDAWNDFINPHVGFVEVKKMGEELAAKNGLVPVFTDHPRPTHKVLKNAELLGISLDSGLIDIFTSDEDKKIADELIIKFVGGNKFGFIQTNTGAGNKELPLDFGVKWLKKNKNLEYFIEVGKTFPATQYNINIQFEILKRADAVCLPESVFYCACGGFNKNVDFLFCAHGIDGFNRIRNLNKDIVENVYFKIPEI